jgi:dihydrofolate synthase / folylpolyglutamate synthase
LTSYNATLKYLYGLQGRGIKLGLRNIRALLSGVGHPESRYPSIHIAGTNGKGSTAAVLASIAMESGLRTALYTSPHLIRFTERIRINGKEIPEARLVAYARELRPLIDKLGATFFEATTCIAFQYFADEGVDIAVIEAGLGGRLDSTNVLTPLVSVITNVGLDHTEILGATLKDIAREKGGIIKPAVPIITSSEKLEVLRTLQKLARLRKSKFYLARELVEVEPQSDVGQLLSVRGEKIRLRNVRPGLSGTYQEENLRTAVGAIEVLLRTRRSGHLTGRITSASVKRGIENVGRNSGIHGRMEMKGRDTIFDVAHNPPGMERLVESLHKQGLKGMPVVFGVMKDKDYGEMIQKLGVVAGPIIAVAPAMNRALSARRLYSALRKSGADARLGGTVRNGIRMARRLGKPILITGSHYVVSEAVVSMSGKKD